MEVWLDGESLTSKEVVAVARGRVKVRLSERSRERVSRAEEAVRELVSSGSVVYGVNTGIGRLSNLVLSAKDSQQLQINIIRSHAAGVGESLPEDVVRAAMLLRANTLAKGFSGCRLTVLQQLVDMLNLGVHPIVPRKGSVGSSGDLAPLSHIALAAIGEGEAMFEGRRMPGDIALHKAGLKKLILESKEAVSLINGTQVMTALGALTIEDAGLIAKVADIAGAMTLEALRGTMTAFSEAVHQLRPHPGQLLSAKNLRFLTEGSELVHSMGTSTKVHDAYSLRCMPQVHGASRDAMDYVRRVIELELNSASDNPLVFVDEKQVISAGNFHGQPVGIAMDLLGIALAEIADISERRTARLLDSSLSGLPPFLTVDSGLNSGLMLLQYTAAALVSENKVLAHPASVDSIPTSANWEDHNSMGYIAADKSREISSNVASVLAIELLCAAQALEFSLPLRPGKGTRAAHQAIREIVPPLKSDRVPYPDMKEVIGLVVSGELVNKVAEAVGELA